MNLHSLVAAIALLSVATSAQAGFQDWTSEIEKDPFSGGSKFTISYMSSLRSGVFVVCDTAASGLEVRVVAGFAYDKKLDDYEPEGKFAFDGKVMPAVKGETGAFGQNVAGARFPLATDEAKAFASGLKGAKSQIAIQDGISDRPHLLKVRGSSKSGQALTSCLDKQAGAAEKDGKAAARFAKFQAFALEVEKKCPAFSIRTGATTGSHLSQPDYKLAMDALPAERAAATAEVAKVSCPAAASMTMQYTDLAYDKVWEVK